MRILTTLAVVVGLAAAPALADTKEVQAALAAVGCYDGPIDGSASLKLKTAIRCFQKGINEASDGTLSDSEENRLLSMASAGDTVKKEERYEAKQIRGSDLPDYEPPELPESPKGSEGQPAPAKIATKPDDIASSAWLPSEADILSSLRSAANSKLRQLDSMANDCRTLSNNIEALNCIWTGFGKYNSRSFSVEVNGVRLEECVRSVEGDAFCRYFVNTTMNGSGTMGDVAKAMQEVTGSQGRAYGRFSYRVDRRWHLIETYQSCTWFDETIECRWIERRPSR